MSILPARAVVDVTGAALKSAPIARAPIGSGRFRFVRWNAGASLEIAADTANYRGRPGLDRVIMTIAPDGNTALTRLLGGEADLIEQVPPTSIADIAKDSTLRALAPVDTTRTVTPDPKNRNHAPRFADRIASRTHAAMPQAQRSECLRLTRQRRRRSDGRAYPTTDTNSAYNIRDRRTPPRDSSDGAMQMAMASAKRTGRKLALTCLSGSSRSRVAWRPFQDLKKVEQK